MTPKQARKSHLECLIAKDLVYKYKEEGYSIVYIDEFCTTKSTIPTHCWSLPRKPIQIDYKQFANKCLASVAAVSAEKGFELIMNFPKSINTLKYAKFLKALREKNKRRKMAIFCDRLGFHHSAATRELMSTLQIPLILNGSYEPELNAIERCIGLAKATIKKQRLNAILQKKRLDLDICVTKAFREIKKVSIENYVLKSQLILS